MANDWTRYEERLPTASTSADHSPAGTSAASPALSDESHLSHLSSAETPPTSTEEHESHKEQQAEEELVPPLPPLEQGVSSRSSTDRPLRHLGLDIRLSGRGQSILAEEEEMFSPRSEKEAEDPFSLSSQVSRSDKIKGRLTTLLGRVTRNPSKILEGEVRSNGAHLALRSEERSAIE